MRFSLSLGAPPQCPPISLPKTRGSASGVPLNSESQGQRIHSLLGGEPRLPRLSRCLKAGIIPLLRYGTSAALGNGSQWWPVLIEYDIH